MPIDTMRPPSGQTTYSAYMSKGSSLGRGILSGKEVDADVFGVISDFTPEMTTLNAYAAASSKKAGAEQLRTKRITMALLKAVAYGMQSSDPAVNTTIKIQDVTFPLKDSSGAPVVDKAGRPVTAQLFNPNLHAESLLKKSPEFLLERGDVTDWAGRTFKKITAFQYAVWAKDFKMIEMMLGCIPETPEGDEIRAQLLEQYEHVTAPTYAGGGLTYTHTYDRPNLDAAGIPDGTTTSVTEAHTENHFDLTILCDAYQDYYNNFDARTQAQGTAYWIKLIGKLQRLLPVHVLQRYCDPNTPFYPLPQFNSGFKRATNFYNYLTNATLSIFGSSLSADFTLIRAARGALQAGDVGGAAGDDARMSGVAALDLAAIRWLDEVSTSETKNIIGQLSQPRHGAELRP